MQITASAFSSPIGGADPFDSEGVRFNCILELADGAGEVKLSANDPNVQPALNYRYLEVNRDVERLRESVRITVNLVEDEGFEPIVAERLQPTDEDLSTDENLDKWMRKTVFNTTSGRFRDEAVGFVCLASAVFLAIALISYNAADPNPFDFAADGTTANWGGPVGAWTLNYWARASVSLSNLRSRN